jgi:hypothetical protein
MRSFKIALAALVSLTINANALTLKNVAPPLRNGACRTWFVCGTNPINIKPVYCNISSRTEIPTTVYDADTGDEIASVTNNLWVKVTQQDYSGGWYHVDSTGLPGDDAGHVDGWAQKKDLRLCKITKPTGRE